MEELIILALMVGAFYLLNKQTKLTQPIKPFTNSQSTQTTADWNSLITKNQQLTQQIEYYRQLTNNNSELKQALNSLLINLKTLNKTI